ncbi:MAG: sigma-70 family RNA polymerase sigma factor [Bryobacter sp.]|nr:sigma-70 family RNA polymerase sigma factor [Bryobacter sp.]
MIVSLPTPPNSRLKTDHQSEETLQLRPIAVPDPSPPPDPLAEFDWHDLVQRVQANEPAALETLYELLSRGIRLLIVRQLGRQDMEDRVHDTFLTVVQAIQRGDLREPDRLLAFARTIVRRRIAVYIESFAAKRREAIICEATLPIADDEPTPEEAAIRAEASAILEQVLRGMSRKDREILTRFYLLEQSPERICQEMDLTDNQFRLLKSRAKARFAEEGRRKTAKNSIRKFFLR